jgi:hypothetical protein
VREQVSVTCFVGDCGGARWWLTRESGAVPAGCVDPECSSCEWSAVGCVPAVSYFVLVVQQRGQRAEVCIARLSRRSVAGVLCGGLRLWHDGRRLKDASGRMAQLMVAGGCYGGRRCSCSLMEGACKNCTGRRGSTRIWIARNGFTGVYPCDEHSWFTGVTDAVDIPAVQKLTGWKWLVCVK